MPEIILITLAKNLFHILKNEVGNQKRSERGGVHPPINPSPIKFACSMLQIQQRGFPVIYRPDKPYSSVPNHLPYWFQRSSPHPDRTDFRDNCTAENETHINAQLVGKFIPRNWGINAAETRRLKMKGISSRELLKLPENVWKFKADNWFCNRNGFRAIINLV